jgi:hypothetical protein
VVGVAGGDGCPGVTRGVGVRDAEGGEEPLLAVGAVVGEGLAGPFAGDQDAAPGVAEVFAAMSLAPAVPRPQAWPGILGLDAVAQPVRAARRARLVAQRLDEAVGMRGLGAGRGPVGQLPSCLGEVLGQIADAAVSVA